MDRTKTDIAYDHVRGIDRSYPDWPSTFGGCRTDGCGNSARGCGYCADCHEEKLAEIVGARPAKEYHDAIKERAAAYGRVYDSAGRADGKI